MSLFNLTIRSNITRWQSINRCLSSSARLLGHENPLGLPQSGTPPMMRMSKGLPTKRKIPSVKRILVISSGKGGVGKSSIAVNLALAIADLSHRPKVGLLDLDIFGPSIPKLMGLEGMGAPILTSQNRMTPLISHGIPCMSMGFLLNNSPSTSSNNSADTPVVWRGMMVMKAVQQLLFDVDWSAATPGNTDLDLLVIDMPPGTGDVTLSLGQLVPIEGSVIVSTPQDVAIIDTRKGVATFKKLGIPIIGAVLNMSHLMIPPSTEPVYIFGNDESFVRTCKELDLKVLGRIPIEPLLSQRGDQGYPIVLKNSTKMDDESQNSITQQSFMELAEKVWQKLITASVA